MWGYRRHTPSAYLTLDNTVAASPSYSDSHEMPKVLFTEPTEADLPVFLGAFVIAVAQYASPLSWT